MQHGCFAVVERVRYTGPPPRVGPVPRALAVILALSAISLLWAVDGHQGAVDMLFFYLPFGFMTVRQHGRVELVRLEFGGLVPVVEGTREKVLRVVKEAFAPAPVPQAPRP